MKKKSSLDSMTKNELLAEAKKLRRKLEQQVAAHVERPRGTEMVKEEGYRILLDESSDPTFIVRADGVCVYANNVFAQSIGKQMNMIVGKDTGEIFRESGLNQFSAIVKWVMENQETKVMDTRIPHKGGDRHYISTAKPIFDKQNELTALICTSKEITDRKKIEDELRYIVSHDTLTGLYNRHFFQTELKRLQRSRQFPVSIVLLDLEQLEVVIDRYGRKTSDAVLVKVGTVLKKTFRTEEIIARIGGGQFAVLLPETGENELSDIVTRLKRDIDKKKDPLLKLTLSSATAKEGTALSELMEQTEDKLFQIRHGFAK